MQICLQCFVVSLNFGHTLTLDVEFYVSALKFKNSVLISANFTKFENILTFQKIYVK
jgi:hypothetical protein